MFDNLKEFLDKSITQLPSESLTGKAINYMLNQWSKLVIYCDSG
ncbi:IS66 family transposase [Vibrio celticus]